MAAPSGDTAMEDLLEDLSLHHVLLQSLEESRPDDIESKEELMEAIKNLEQQVARLRGDRPRPSSTAPSRPSHGPLQMDGGSDEGPTNSSNIPRWGGSQQASVDNSRDSPSSRSRGDVRYPDTSRFLQPLPTRKRQYEDIDAGYMGESSEPVSKRNTPMYPRSVSSTPTASTSSAGYGDAPRSGDAFEASSELQQLLGLDGLDTLNDIQRHQQEAEKWLEERREQERRDEELARKLQEGWTDGPTTTSSSPAPSHATLDSIAMPPPRNQSFDRLGHDTRRELPSFGPGDFFAPRSHQASAALANRQPLKPSTSDMAASRPLSSSHYDSSDSDIAEITPRDFERSARQSSRPPPAGGPISRDTKSSSNYPSYSWDAQNHRNTATLGNANGYVYPQYGYGDTNTAASQNTWYGPNILQNTMARLNDTKKKVFDNASQMYNSLSGPSSSSFGQYYGDLVSTFSSFGGNSDEYDYLRDRYRDLYDDFSSDPKKTTEEIKQLLETIRPDMELAMSGHEGTPEALKYPLMEHQKLGLAWMKSMEESEQKGGILADDMGLGKTIQALALIVARPSIDPERMTTLIVAPVALMQQWKREIERMLRPGKFQKSIYVLHGDKRSVKYKDLKKYDVVLTTFGTLASEFKRREEWRERHGRNGNISHETYSLPILGPGCKWYRTIIDEAQCIKNRNTKAALAACCIDSTYRWCMSGTPMMNAVTELHSLLRFLRIRPYCELERFNAVFTRPLKSSSTSAQSKAMRQLQVLLKAVLLRRTKTSEIDGKPILQLPPRITEEVHAVFSDDEQELYQALETRTQLQFNKYLKAGTVGRNYSNVLVLLLRLRQACCHPHLLSDFSVDVNASTGELDLVANAKEFGQEVVIRLKENDNLECPVCIDAVENPIIFFPCGHSTCAECFARISDPALAVRLGHDGSVEVKCPNCRAKVDPKKVTDHVSFRKVHYPEEGGGIAQDEAQEEDEVDEEDDDSDDNSDEDDSASLSRFIVDDEENGEGNAKPKKTKGKGKAKSARGKKRTLAELKKEGMKNAKAKAKYLRRLEKTWVTSAKIEKTMEILEQTESRNEGEKTIIFSQFTSLLDLLEIPVMRKGWRYHRYDGSMKPAERNSAVIDFTDNPDCRVMLVSLKAGNSGLNLVAASQVIIFDPFWNPYIEEQAIDRAHRIGQMREVRIHRVLVKNTVEDRILALQEKKRELIEGALDENASKNVSRLGTRELAYLFGIQN
ncbi:hypothetical protein Plec18167_006438 [Paecilomyces lecythidis]|uniref:Uncharacterized protein n=1 Tax=Paecilomyces lecythidis TaxID=3004212 RepID=A0ABR3XCH5_9EURO